MLPCPGRANDGLQQQGLPHGFGHPAVHDGYAGRPSVIPDRCEHLQGESGQLRVRPDGSRQLHAVHVRHLEIQNGQLERLLRSGGRLKVCERLIGRRGQYGDRAPGVEMIILNLALGSGVIDDENPSLE